MKVRVHKLFSLCRSACVANTCTRAVPPYGDIDHEDVMYYTFFKPDYVQITGRYFLLYELGDEGRKSAFIKNRRQATIEAYGVSRCQTIIKHLFLKSLIPKQYAEMLTTWEENALEKKQKDLDSISIRRRERCGY